MSIRHYGFGNLGRDKSPKVGTQRLDRDALSALWKRLPHEQCAVFLCEINEGDDNDEMALIRRVFRGWRLYGATTREPILLSPDQPKASANVVWVPNTAVKEWSPPRSVLTVALADEPETLIGCHPAAGANGQGDRPRHALEPLQASWNATITVRDRIKRRHHAAGRNVTEQLDANAYDTHTLPLQPGETVVWHDATDWGRVWPAAGYTADFHPGGQVDFRLDSHDGHLMHGTYRKETS